MKPETLDVLIWVLIYAGLIGVGLGLAIERNDAALGWGVASASGIVQRQCSGTCLSSLS